MEVRRYEIKKLLLDHKMLYAIIVFQVIAFLMLLFGDIPANLDIENNLKGYTYYLKSVEGEVTEKTDDFFITTAETFTAMESELQTIYEKVSDGKLTKGESKLRISELEKTLQKKEGFLVLYDQYTDAKTNRSNRYLLNTNAWDALLSDGSLDFFVIIFVMLIASVCFGSEIASEMDVMLRISLKGEKRLGLYKLRLVMVVSSLNFILEYAIKIWFYHIKYGFSHGDYPLQSLSGFQSYLGEVSLLEASFGVFMWKLLGVVMWSVIVCALMLWLRKYAIVMITAFSGLIMAYVGISKEYFKYYLPGPLGALLGTGFYKGNEYTVSEFGGKKIYSFIQLSGNAKIIIFIVNILIIACLVFYVTYKYANCWNRWNVFKKRNIICIFMTALCIGMTTGCTVENNDNNQIFNLRNSTNYESGNYLLYYDVNENEGTIMVRDKATGKTTKLVKDVYQASKEILDAFYVDGDYAYYIEMTYDKEDKYFVNEYDKISLIKVDLTDFSARTIFSESIKTTKKDIFGINESHNENNDIYPVIVSFFVYKNEFCFVTADGEVYDVNISTGKKEFLFLCNGISLSFMNGNFYYTDKVSRLIKYDMKSREEYLYEDIATTEFIVSEEFIIYKDSTSGDALTCTDLTGDNKRVIYKGSIYFLAADKNAIYYIDDEEILHEVDFNGKEIKNIQTTLASGIYIFPVYDKIISNIYGEKITEHEK